MSLTFQTYIFSLLRFLQLSVLSIWKFDFGCYLFLPKSPKFSLTNCLTNIKIAFSIVSFDFLCSAVQTFHVEGSYPWKTPKFSQNNCLTNNFLYIEFLLSMKSSSKVGGGSIQISCLTNVFLYSEFQLSIFSS